MASAQSPEEDTPVPTTEVEPTVNPVESSLTTAEYKAMQSVLDTAYNHRTEDDHDPSKLFHRKVNKRFLPDYYEVIKDPIAMSTIKMKIFQKAYKDFPEYVRDWAQIIHNAKVYNRPDAGAYHDALELERLVKSELQNLVSSRLITSEVATFPYLGEIPPQDALPAEENEGGEEDEDDEDDAADESDEDRRKSKTRKSKVEEDQKDDAQTADAQANRKRGRPPKVFTPLEARLYNILKAMRRIKNQADEPMILSFERLPDRAVLPGYYDEIRNPMCMDVVRRKVKRKKYQSIEEFMQDVNLMFENAKAYNEDESEIYKYAVELQRETQRIVSTETRKPDSEYIMEDGRLPLPEGILHRGELYKVGDWVHIQNANDLTKPIVAQIYRTWQDSNGHKFVNACWYYRPEQTVHRFDKHFYENEVVKTGNYRDHSIDEVVDRCFVMFITRYPKGRPRNLPYGKEIYVCESRYNDDKFTLNKIKTWASCLPDEVRDKDYEMELYPEPRRLKKLPSPIAYLLKDSQKETDDFPKPEWGADNAPPKIGAVHRRPREGKESPPPEPTPEPNMAPPQPRPSYSRQISSNVSQQPSTYSRAPNHSFTVPTPARQASGLTSQTPTSNLAQVRQYQPMMTPAASNAQGQSQVQRLNSYSSAHTPSVPQTSRLPSDYTSRYSQAAAIANANLNAASYKTPQPIEVWSLNDAANAAIPQDIREQFQCDEEGRVLFFTAPPIDTETLATSEVKSDLPLGHSVSYLAAKADRDAKVREGRKRKAERELEVAEKKRREMQAERVDLQRVMNESLGKALMAWEAELERGIKGEYEMLYGSAEAERRMRESLRH